MQGTRIQPTLNPFVKWLSKKESSLSLHFNFNKAPRSILTLNESDITHIGNDDSHKHDSYDYDLPPPAYDDKVHPWAFELPNYLKSRKVYPREEEGNEIIPDYQCTVQKTELAINIKCEKVKRDIKAKDRSWRNVSLEIRGTIIMAYYFKHKKRILLWSHSMEDAQVSLAKDYTKYRHVIRLLFKDGRQFLLRTHSEKHSAEWIALVESSANISTDLDKRLMPKFNTLPSRNAGHCSRRRV
ncbi:hypothetical protein K501DRAFT_335956 [Backusella circina FSU 941]|nr:hypothetical protein K501DRAFT_335956 [Backusella circina FSU 941]